MVDVVHGAAGGFLGYGLLRLTLRAHKQHRLPLARKIGKELGRLLKELQCLLQVDDVDPVAFPVDVLLHLRVPAARLVAEVNSSLQEFLHRNIRQKLLLTLVGATLVVARRGHEGRPYTYRFENWNRLRAPFCPYFLRSLARGSRVRKPPWRKRDRSSALKITRARAMPS